MAITVQEKYQRLKEKLKDPVYYANYRKKCLERQRRYARNPEYCKKRALSSADWRWRKDRGLPTRPRHKIRPTNVITLPCTPEPPPGPTGPFEFSLVSAISVAFD